MKKIGLVCAVLFSLLLGCFRFQVNAEEDKQGPTMTGLTLSKSSVTAPGEIKVTMTAEDDVSGFNYATIQFYCQEADKYLYVSIWPDENGKLTGTLSLNQYTPSGKYLIYHVSLSDKADNSSIYYGKAYPYYNSGAADCLPSTLASKSFTVINNTSEDKEGPTISGLTLSKSSVTAPGEIKVTMTAEDDVSGFNYATIQFYCQDADKYLYVSIWPDENGKLTGALKIDENTPSGKYLIYYVSLSDKADNSSIYYGKAYPYYNSGAANCLPSTLASKSFTVINNTSEDKKGPTVSGLTLSKSSLTAPGELKVTMTAEDDVSGVNYGSIQFYCQDADKYLYTNLWLDENGKLTGTLSLDEYTPSGKYYIYHVYIADMADNSSIYYGKAYPYYNSDVADCLPSTLASKSFTVLGEDSVAITTQPKNVTVAEGDTAKFSVKAYGTGLSYQWYYRKTSSDSWTAVAAASGKTATYSLTTAERHNGYQYRCRVKNSSNSVYSKTVTLTVCTKPVISTQPKSVTAAEGKTAKFTVAATGEALTYQWYYRKTSSDAWTAVSASSGKTAAYSLTTAERHNGYQYRCKVTNLAGNTYTKTVTLTVCTTPAITTQPKSASVTAGTIVKFTVKATGNALTYQWYYRKTSSDGWTEVAAASGKTATYSLTTAARHNGYQYKCVITNKAGSVTTSIVKLTVK